MPARADACSHQPARPRARALTLGVLALTIALRSQVSIAELSLNEVMGDKDQARAADSWHCREQGERWELDGSGSCFWASINDPELNAERAVALDNLFRRKYPSIPGDMPPPNCDGGE